jgi:hypothetical protein
MAHVRQQCRDAIVTALQATATAGSNVLTNVVYDIGRLTLPAIGVAESSEQRNPITMPQPRRFEVHSDFAVTIYAEDNTDCEAALDDISAEIEVALAMPIAGPWKQLTQIASGIEMQAAETVRGRRILRYQAVYLIREDQPEVAL